MNVQLIEDYNIELVNLNLDRFKRRIDKESVQFSINFGVHNINWVDDEQGICEAFVELELKAIELDKDEELEQVDKEDSSIQYCRLNIVLNLLIKSNLKKEDVEEEELSRMLTLLAQPTMKEIVNQNLYRVGLPGVDIPYGV